MSIIHVYIYTLDEKQFTKKSRWLIHKNTTLIGYTTLIWYSVTGVIMLLVCQKLSKTSFKKTARYFYIHTVYNIRTKKNLYKIVYKYSTSLSNFTNLRFHTFTVDSRLRFLSSGFFHESIVPRPQVNTPKYFRFCGDIYQNSFVFRVTIPGRQKNGL